MQNSKKGASKMIKRRRLAIVTFAIVALLLVSVGFAFITGDLSITATAKSGPQDFNVVFTKAKLIDLNDAAQDGKVLTVKVENTKLESENAEVTIGGTTGAFVTTMTVENIATTADSVTVHFTVKNNNKVPMKVTVADPATSIFNAAYGFTSSDATLTKSATIAANAEAIFEVTITLKNDAYDVEKSETIKFEFDGTSEVN